MTDGTQFTIDPEADDGFFVAVGDELTVYEQYDTAVAEVQDKVSTEADSFVAEVTIENNGSDDVAINLEQVGWQQIIQDMAKLEEPDNA